jgi:hypothetical protein
MNTTPDQLPRAAGRSASLAIASGVLLLVIATYFALAAGVIALMNQRVMGARYWMVLAAAVVLAFVPGTAFLVFAGPVRRLRFWAVAGALALSSIQSLLALGLLTYMLYFSTGGLNPFLFVVEFTCLVLGALLTANLVRVSAYAYARPGFGFEPQLRATASGTPIPTPPPAHTR